MSLATSPHLFCLSLLFFGQASLAQPCFLLSSPDHEVMAAAALTCYSRGINCTVQLDGSCRVSSIGQDVAVSIQSPSLENVTLSALAFMDYASSLYVSCPSACVVSFPLLSEVQGEVVIGGMPLLQVLSFPVLTSVWVDANVPCSVILQDIPRHAIVSFPMLERCGGVIFNQNVNASNISFPALVEIQATLQVSNPASSVLTCLC